MNNARFLRSLVAVLIVGSACVGGQSGSPTPFVPDPQCTESARTTVGATEVPDGHERSAQETFAELLGVWTGSCGDLAIEIDIEDIAADVESLRYEWTDYGNTDVEPVECRRGYETRLQITVRSTAPEPAQATVGQDAIALYTNNGSRAELHISQTMELEPGGIRTDPASPNPNERRVHIGASLRPGNRTMTGKLEWFGQDDSPQEIQMPPPVDDADPGTDGYNPTPGQPVAMPDVLQSECALTLHRQ